MATALEHLESFLDSLQDPEPKGFVIVNEGASRLGFEENFPEPKTDERASKRSRRRNSQD